MRTKNVAVLSLIAISGLLLVGCTSNKPEVITFTQTATTAPPVQVTTSPEVKLLIKNTVDAICTLNGKKTLTAVDLKKFTDLAIKLNACSGESDTYIHSVAKNMNSLASTYKTLEGRELPADIQSQFATGCSQANASYQKAFGK